MWHRLSYPLTPGSAVRSISIPGAHLPKKTSLRRKRKILQKGGFLSVLLRPVLSVLGNLFMKHVIERKSKDSAARRTTSFDSG